MQRRVQATTSACATCPWRGLTLAGWAACTTACCRRRPRRARRMRRLCVLRRPEGPLRRAIQRSLTGASSCRCGAVPQWTVWAACKARCCRRRPWDGMPPPGTCSLRGRRQCMHWVGRMAVFSKLPCSALASVAAGIADASLASTQTVEAVAVATAARTVPVTVAPAATSTSPTRV
jgi:hypothetical protein